MLSVLVALFVLLFGHEFVLIAMIGEVLVWATLAGLAIASVALSALVLVSQAFEGSSRRNMALLPNWFRASIAIPVRIAFFWLRGDTSVGNVLLIGSALVQFPLFMSEIILPGADIFAAHTMLSADLPASSTVDLLETASSFSLSYYPVRLGEMSSRSAVQLGILERSLCSTPNNCSALRHDAAVSWAIEAQVLGLHPTHSTPFPTQHVVTNGPSAVHNQSRQVSAIATMLHSPLLSQSAYT